MITLYKLFLKFIKEVVVAMVCVSTNIASSFFLHRAWHPHSSISRISHMDTIDKIVESSLTCNHTWQNFKGLPLKTQISPLLQIPAGDICACKQLKISTSCVQFKCFCKKQSHFLLGFPSFTSLADSLNASGSCSFSISWQRISDVTDFSKVFRFWMEDAYPQYLNLEGCTGLISMQEATIKRNVGMQSHQNNYQVSLDGFMFAFLNKARWQHLVLGQVMSKM